MLEPTLLLLDEPLGALDLKLREHMKIELKQLQADFGTTFVYITHDQSEALVLSDHVAVMNAGRFEQVGTPQELYYDPQTRVRRGVRRREQPRRRARRRASTATSSRSPRPRDSRVRARASGAIAAGDAVEAFVRPGGRSISRAMPPSCRAGAQRFSGRVASLLFDGANSAVLVREERTRAEIRIALPQTGRFADLARRRDGRLRLRRATRRLLPLAREPWLARQAIRSRRGRGSRCCCCSRRRSVWLVGLIVLPHVELAVLSLRARVAPRVYEWSLEQYATFVDEPLYWHTFVRTAAMSIFATVCTLAIAFPVAWYIAKIARGRAKSLLFVLCLIPFWVSETVRTLGWMILLRESGVLPRLLVDLGITAAPVEMLYHDATILVGLVYTSMLFMVVPLVSALESLDDSLIEAAYDLGGNGWSILRADRHPARGAGNRRRIDRRVHADARQLPDAHAARRQELAVVHRADLHAVHHALQLGAGRGVRLPAARPVDRDRLGRAQDRRASGSAT